MEICKECAKEFETESSLHRHVRAHGVNVAGYYQKYFPRTDKFTNEIIPFKNKEQYFSADFNERDNLRKWIDVSPPATVRAYLKEVLERRKNKKNLEWAPTQVELRTCMLPPIQTYNAFFGNYFNLCQEMGLKNRFKSNQFFNITYKPEPYTIYIDSREQLPLEFVCPTENKALKFGDYACSNHETTCRCYIERKSAQDFVGTLSGGFERFCRELDRSVAAGAYMVVLCEENLGKMLHFDKLPQVYHKNSCINPEYVFRNVRDIIQKYSNCQFLFINGRQEASRIIQVIFDSNCTYKDVDLQMLHDLGKL